MKNLLFFIVMFLVFGCSNQPKCYDYKTVLNVSPQYSTRIFVTYISKCGDTIVSTVHHSRTIKADNITFYAGDYIKDNLKYGDIK